jgi:holo-[acyl-carrier protein] synthase
LLLEYKALRLQKTGRSMSTAQGGNRTSAHASTLRMGFDLVQISTVARSLDHFGDAYERRIFTEGELRYARSSSPMAAQRLAARFAAKEAVMKALQLGEAGVGWRDIEVVKHDSGDCGIVLHGRAAEVAEAAGAQQIILSMSHDGDYAGANVCVLFAQAATGFS